MFGLELSNVVTVFVLSYVSCHHFLQSFLSSQQAMQPPFRHPCHHHALEEQDVSRCIFPCLGYDAINITTHLLLQRSIHSVSYLQVCQKTTFSSVSVYTGSQQICPVSLCLPKHVRFSQKQSQETPVHHRDRAVDPTVTFLWVTTMFPNGYNNHGILMPPLCHPTTSSTASSTITQQVTAPLDPNSQCNNPPSFNPPLLPPKPPPTNPTPTPARPPDPAAPPPLTPTTTATATAAVTSLAVVLLLLVLVTLLPLLLSLLMVMIGDHPQVVFVEEPVAH